MHDLARSYIREVKAFQARHEHDTDFFRLARGEGILVTPGKRNTYLPGDPPVIMIESGLYSAQVGRQIGLHELAHHIAQSRGFEDDLRDHSADWDDAEQLLEALCQVGTAMLQLPDTMLAEAHARHGHTATAVAWLHEISGAPSWAVLRRWVHADEDMCRAAWVSSGSIVTDAAAQDVRLPFWTHSRVPEVGLMMPDASLAMRGRQTVGVVGW